MPASPTLETRSTSTGVVAAVFGNMLEFYDFTVYAFFAVAIGKVFFPVQDGFLSLLLSVATFGVGFVTRPLGAFVIGAYADRVGRKPALMLTIVLMAIGMLILAVTPGYATIGLAAPLLVVTARLIQGFALGGDVGAASAFLIENAPGKARGLHGSWQIASQGASTLLAGLVGTSLSALLSPEQMQGWGWRVAVGLGLLVVPVGFFMRRAMPETLVAAEGEHVAPLAFVARLFARHGRTILLGVLICAAATIATYTGNYLTTYGLTTLHLPPTIALGGTAVVGFCSLTGALAGGWLSDRWSRRSVAAWFRLLNCVMAVPVFLLMTAHPTPAVFFVVAAVFTWANAFSSATGVILVAEAFPRAERGLGLAVTYAIGISIFGGTTQFILTWLIRATGSPIAPAWYVAATGVVGFAATMLLGRARAA